MAKVKITLVRSLISCPETQRRTAHGLGLRKLNHSVIQPANLPVLGMVRKIKHLVRIEEVADTAEEAQAR